MDVSIKIVDIPIDQQRYVANIEGKEISFSKIIVEFWKSILDPNEIILCSETPNSYVIYGSYPGYRRYLCRIDKNNSIKYYDGGKYISSEEMERLIQLKAFW